MRPIAGGPELFERLGRAARGGNARKTRAVERGSDPSVLAPPGSARIRRIAERQGCPPVTETFFMRASAKKPIHCPSGEKNGSLAPSVPARTTPFA